MKGNVNLGGSLVKLIRLIFIDFDFETVKKLNS
jgi:hypothetical protein